LLQIDEPTAVVTSPAADPAEVLIKEARGETRRRRLRNGGIALLLLMLIGGIVGASRGSAPPPPVTSAKNPPPASFPQVSAALSHVPVQLRQALLATMESNSFIAGEVVYQAPDRSGPPSGHNYKLPCQGTGGMARPPVTIIGSYEYRVSETCPGATLSVFKSRVPKSSYGLTFAQYQMFGSWITELQGSQQFRQSAEGYSWVVGKNAFPGVPGFNVYRNVPGRAVIQNDRVTAFILYMRFPSGKVNPARFTFSRFNDAPPVAVPKAS